MSQRIFFLDGHSLLHRAYWALPVLTTAQGEYTNAVYGFTTMLWRLLDDYQPSAMFVAFDTSAPTFRHKEYDQYKATRKKMPDELRPQVPLVKEVLDAFGIPRLELEGYEADDVIGTAARLAAESGHQAVIVTGDRDALQLVSDQVQVLLTKKGVQETELVDANSLQEDYQLTPEQVPELKGLMGDASDNIPGIPGVGEKTAKKLLAQYHTIEELYDHVDETKGKLKDKLITYKDQALLSRRLATIDQSVPLEIDITRAMEPDKKVLEKLFLRLEFKSLLQKLQQWVPHVPRADNAGSSARLAEDIPWQTVDSGSSRAFRRWLQTPPQTAAAATQGAGRDFSFKTLLLLRNQSAYALTADSSRADWIAGLEALVAADDLNTPAAKQLIQAMMVWNLTPAIALDAELAAYVLDPSGEFDFDAIALRWGGFAPISNDLSDIETLLEQAVRMGKLADSLEAALHEDGLWPLYNELELPLARVLADMEHRGILVEPSHLKQLSKAMEANLQDLQANIHELAGEKFNVNSPKQLGQILFEKLGLPVIRRTKTGPSTDAEVLEQLQDHPIVAYILDYRQKAKLKNTYADALAHLIHPETKRIHTTFNQTITATGRLSSTNPNLQNIPIRTEAGRDIRRAFVAPPGRVLLAADYSQIELRVLAHISEDEKMCAAFRDGLDIHRQTAAEVLGIDLEEVSKEQRSAAKAINFGIVYGISAFGLARNTKISQEKAQEYIKQYFLRYPKIKVYMDETVKKARRDGYVTTIFGRRRYLPDIRARSFPRRSFAERTAMNSPIQGSAADIIKRAMLAVAQQLKNEQLQSVLLLQVHDELVLEVPHEEIQVCGRLVRREMVAAADLIVPLTVDVQFGTNWKEMESFQD